MQWQEVQLDLECYPAMPDHIARPWDSADEYILEYRQHDVPTLIFNDRFGALALTVPEACIWSESACARIATERNLARNHFPASSDRWVCHIPQHVQQVLIKIPKDFELLRYWLECIQRHAPQATVLLAGMAKHIPVNWLKWLEAHAGNYCQHPIKRKARLLELSGLKITDSVQVMAGYHWQALRLEAFPGVFGRHQMDIGSRFLLETLAEKPIISHGRVCDLGCGNGLLGLALKRENPTLDVVLTDDSRLAVESAQHNATINGLDIQVVQGDTLQATQGVFDLIVCNPPFHDGHRQLTNLAQRMFAQAARQLSDKGQLWIVANRHLPYQAMLKRSFRDVQVIKQNAKFMIYRCAMTRHSKENNQP